MQAAGLGFSALAMSLFIQGNRKMCKKYLGKHSPCFESFLIPKQNPECFEVAEIYTDPCAILEMSGLQDNMACRV